jgi:hypothetical protein
MSEFKKIQCDNCKKELRLCEVIVQIKVYNGSGIIISLRDEQGNRKYNSQEQFDFCSKQCAIDFFTSIENNTEYDD